MSSIKQVFIFIAIVLGIVLWRGASELFQYYPIVNFPPKGQVVLALGDSITSGVGASAKEKNYIGLLEKRLSVQIINRGVSGATSKDILISADNIISEIHPNIVILLIGGNDILQQVLPQETLNNVREVIRIAQKHGAVVFLIGIQKQQNDAYGVGFEKIAHELGAVYVPDILEGIFGNSEFMYDEVHPNDKGYLKIADKIAPQLEGIIYAGASASRTNSD